MRRRGAGRAGDEEVEVEGWAAIKWAKTEWIWVASSLFDEEKGGRISPSPKPRGRERAGGQRTESAR